MSTKRDLLRLAKLSSNLTVVHRIARHLSVVYTTISTTMSPASSRNEQHGFIRKSMVAGHFAERHFAERHFAERHFAEGTFCRRTLCRTNISSNGQFDKRTFRRKDILPKRKLAENREILGDVTRTAYDWLLK